MKRSTPLLLVVCSLAPLTASGTPIVDGGMQEITVTAPREPDIPTVEMPIDATLQAPPMTDAEGVSDVLDSITPPPDLSGSGAGSGADTTQPASVNPSAGSGADQAANTDDDASSNASSVADLNSESPYSSQAGNSDAAPTRPDGAGDVPTLADPGAAFTTLEKGSSGSDSAAPAPQVAASRAAAMASGSASAHFEPGDSYPIGTNTRAMDNARVQAFETMGQKARTTDVPIPQPTDGSAGF